MMVVDLDVIDAALHAAMVAPDSLELSYVANAKIIGAYAPIAAELRALRARLSSERIAELERESEAAARVIEAAYEALKIYTCSPLTRPFWDARRDYEAAKVPR